MDWNVFFSTVSQTSGAIVGIFAAFLITKIVSNQSTFEQNMEKLHKQLSLSKKLQSETEIRRFDWYNRRRLSRLLEDIDKNIFESGVFKEPEQYLELYSWSKYQSKKDILIAIKDHLETFKEKMEREHSPFMSSIAQIQSASLHAHTMDLIKMENAELESIKELYVRVSHQCDENYTLANGLKLNSESSSLVSLSIIAVVLLFFLGVIYPLSFLPVSTESELTLSLSAFWDILLSLKGAILGLISLVFTGLMITFYFVNHRMKYQSDTLELLMKYSKPESYSVYYSNYVVNSAT